MYDVGHHYLLNPLTERELEILQLISVGHSNREIAQELVLSLGTIKWYNRQIYSKLGVHSRTKAAAKAEELNLFSEQPEKPLPPTISPKHNLPASITSFIGREQEIVELKKLLSVSRMVTLSGPGGVGKTRLALQVAQQVLDWFEDGVWFIDLAPLRDHTFFVSTIVKSLDIQLSPGKSQVEILKKHLQDKKILLLLDNFEQIIEAAPLIGELLVSLSKLKVLVTSRETLQIYGEDQYPVPPLSLPSIDHPRSLREVIKYESIELFRQRANSVMREFILTEQNVNTVAEICLRLDGLPLAIELAAARCKILTPEKILIRLQNRLDALSIGSRGAPDRLRTIRGTLEWSYNLLETEEKKLFSRLSVFQGGRSIEAVEFVCSPGLEMDVLDGIESLLNKNLIFQEKSIAGETRFHFLETVHEYALEKLEESSEAEYLHERHAEYFLDFVEHAESQLFGDRQVYWTDRLRDELDNLRTALTWTLKGEDIELGARLVGALREYWYSEGHIIEGLSWIEVVLERVEDIPKSLKPKLLNAAGYLSFAKGDLESGKVYHHKAMILAQEMDDKYNLAWSLVLLAGVSMESPEEAKEGIPICEEGLALFRDLAFTPGILRALNILGELFRMTGDYKKARNYYHECLELCRQTGNKQREALMLGNLGTLAMHKKDYQQAKKLMLDAFTLSIELKNQYFISMGLAFVAGPEVAIGYPDRAARILGASETALKSLGLSYQPQDQADIDSYIDCARQQLDEETFEKAWAEGRRMSLEEAITYASRS